MTDLTKHGDYKVELSDGSHTFVYAWSQKDAEFEAKRRVRNMRSAMFGAKPGLCIVSVERGA